VKLGAVTALAVCAGALYAQNEAYVVDNSVSGRVLVVDLTTRLVKTAISTGRESSEILILPNNRFAFVSNAASNNVVMLDLPARQVVATIGTGGGPGSMAVTPDGRTLYVADGDTNDVTVVDVASRMRIAMISVDATPVALDISPNGRLLYVVNQDELPTGTVSVIDTSQNKVVQTLSVGLKPSGFVIAPNGTTGYVVNTGSNSISVVDLTGNQVIGTPIAVGSSPVNLAITADGRRLYSLNQGSSNISVIDAAQNRVIGVPITVGTRPADMAITSDGLYAFVTNMGSGNVSVVNLATNAVEDTITVGNQPFSATFDPNEDFLFVTNLGSGTISAIDANSDALVSTVAVGGLPVQFEFLNAPTLTDVSPNPAPAGAQLTLKGEGFVAGSTVQFVTTAPPRTLTPAVTFVNSETLLTTAPDIGQATATVSVLNPDGNSSEGLPFRLGQPPPPPPGPVTISAGGVVEGAGFQKAPYPISGGGIVSVFGTFTGALQQQAMAFPLLTSLGNTTVTFNGTLAPLLFTSTGQINLVAPTSLLGTTSAQVVVTVAGQASAPATVNLAPAAPGIFIIDPSNNAGAFEHANGSIISDANPARRGETIIMFLTGLGATTPPAADGQPASFTTLSRTVVTPVVTVSGTPANLRFSGLTPGFSGLYQINFDVPATAPSGSAAVAVTAAGLASNSVRLAMEP
jgi:uncharacterized protein (TIGR03437 family)